MGLFDAIDDISAGVDSIVGTAEDAAKIVQKVRSIPGQLKTALSGPIAPAPTTSTGGVGKKARKYQKLSALAPGQMSSKQKKKLLRLQAQGFGQTDPGETGFGYDFNVGTQPVTAIARKTGAAAGTVMNLLPPAAAGAATKVGIDLAKGWLMKKGGDVLSKILPDPSATDMLPAGAPQYALAQAEGAFLVALAPGILQANATIPRGFKVPVTDRAGGSAIGEFVALKQVPRHHLLWFPHPQVPLSPAYFPGLKAYPDAGLYLEGGSEIVCIRLGPKPKRRRKTLTPKRLARFRTLARMVERHDKLVKKTKRLCKMR